MGESANEGEKVISTAMGLTTNEQKDGDMPTAGSAHKRRTSATRQSIALLEKVAEMKRLSQSPMNNKPSTTDHMQHAKDKIQKALGQRNASADRLMTKNKEPEQRDQSPLNLSQCSSASGGIGMPVTTSIGVFAQAGRNRPKQSLLTDRSLTIEELAKLHENMKLFTYCEPTNEQGPNRPIQTRPMSRMDAKRRFDLAQASSRLSMHAFLPKNEELKDEYLADGGLDESSVSEMFPQMDAAKSMREVLDLKGLLDYP